MSLVIIVLLFIVFIFIFVFDTKDKRGALNSIGLDLSEDKIEQLEDKDLTKKAKALIANVEYNLKRSNSLPSTPKEKYEAIRDDIDATFAERGYPKAAERALEILEEKINNCK